MLDIQSVAPESRGKLMLKWRTTLGWNVGEAAKRVGVSTRTISAIESGAQIMQDSRWRLFVHEVLAEITSARYPEMVVVLSKQQTPSDLQIPLDVVSSDNYAGYAISDDGKEGLIASYSVNRLTGAPEVHRQRFFVEPNLHVIRAIERWEAARQEATPDRTSFEVQRWLMRRVLKGELHNPELIQLKEAIAVAKAELDQASEASDAVRAELIHKLDMAIADLMEAVAKATKK